jgi:23S rRNA (cytidine1920-2'-O)/16S rRNA (cytidine1409-2'-O)-methyltransferase
MAEADCPYVSRGGLKLQAALDAFGLAVAGGSAADLGCNVGGFTDCLLQRGAARVFAVDTGYGALAWKLRQDPRVTVLERQNALHLDPATLPNFTPVDLVVVDLGWTRQKHAVPAALRWVKPDGRIITLIKPHYESQQQQLRGKRGVLSDDDAAAVVQRVLTELPALGVTLLGDVASPIRGGAGKGRSGNLEHLALLKPGGTGGTGGAGGAGTLGI